MTVRIASAVSGTLVLLFFAVAPAAGTPPGPTPLAVVEGVASFVWGDPHPELGGQTALHLSVLDASHRIHRFSLSPGGPLADLDPGALQGRRVRVLFDPSRGPGAEPAGLLVLDVVPPDALEVTGSQPWISLLCKFSNLSGEPRALSYFVQMYDNSPGRLDHYWRETSYDLIDVVGSGAYGWVVLTHPQSYYMPTPGSGCGSPGSIDHAALFFDCTAAADPFVDFSLGGTGGYVGINLMFNGDLDGCAWGGGMTATLDGVNKGWRTTWEPPWGYQNVSVMAHEMGHGFGLPHSNNWDGDGSPYDNDWDVMSSSWRYAASDPTYGGLGKHTITHHKDRLGWFAPGEIWTPPGDGHFPIVVSDHALATVDGYRMARLPIPDSNRYWTLETRNLTGLYDAELPGHAVIVHEINPSRGEPAWCFDPAVPPGGFADTESVMWRVGETFVSPTGQSAPISARIDAETADGFAVTISYGVEPALFVDDFETGDTVRWADTEP